MQKGFTLAELLISLAILGIIATFTIPKMLQNQQNGQNKAVFRETIASLYTVMQTGMRNQAFLGATNHAAYFKSNLNAIKTCNNSAAEGCWTGDTGIANTNEDGVIMPNGSQVCGFNNGDDAGGGRWSNVWIIDANGAAGPNVIGQDVVRVWYCYGSADCGGSWPWLPAVAPVGRMGAQPDPVAGAGNEQLYNDIFSN